jgi:hypothetical protein
MQWLAPDAREAVKVSAQSSKKDRCQRSAIRKKVGPKHPAKGAGLGERKPPPSPPPEGDKETDTMLKLPPSPRLRRTSPFTEVIEDRQFSIEKTGDQMAEDV